jgi:RNA polymerase-associated protein LEO1
MAAELMQVVGHITNQYTVNPNKVIEDVALEKLQSSLAAATRGRNKNDVKDGIALISSNEDPELQKQKAELAEKERMKAQRRREAAAARADQQSGRVRGAIGGGLSLDDLEGRSRATGSRKKRSAPSGPRRPRRRADYDTDDEDVPRGHNREDEYDLEDDFLDGSDEEQEVDDGDESEEELDEESEAEESPKPKKQKTSKSESTEVKAAPDSDIDAEGEDDVPLVPEPTNDAAGGRGRKRHIIEDDEDDE